MIVLLRFFVQRRITVGVIVGILFILFSAFGTILISSEYQQTLNEVGQNIGIQSNITKLLVQVIDAETGQRGYIITGNASYLAPYDSAIGTINATESSLQTGITGNPNLTAMFQAVKPIVSQKLAELAANYLGTQTNSGISGGGSGC